MFICKHPTVWKLFGGLRRDIGFHRLTVQNAEAMNFQPGRLKYRILAERLAQKVATYDVEMSNEDKYRFIKSIAHMQVA